MVKDTETMEGGPMDPEKALPPMPEETADLLAQTVEDMVRERLRAMGLDGGASAVAQGRGLYLVDPTRLPPPPPVPPPAPEMFAVPLPTRFADYIRRRAEAHGDDPQHHIAGIVKAFWQNDLWRLQGSQTAPQQLGQPAGTSMR